jgi:hypothetical protein
MTYHQFVGLEAVAMKTMKITVLWVVTIRDGGDVFL